jgi:hypothetical protein
MDGRFLNWYWKIIQVIGDYGKKHETNNGLGKPYFGKPPYHAHLGLTPDVVYY